MDMEIFEAMWAILRIRVEMLCIRLQMLCLRLRWRIVDAGFAVRIWLSRVVADHRP